MRPRKERRRMPSARRVPFESLEERDLLTVIVNVDTTPILPDVPAIVITGSGFDPIVSNNTVTFNDGAAGTVTSATDTQLTVEFTTPPIEAGILTAIVATSTEDSGSAVQVATVVPVVTASTASLAANATTLTISGSGFDTTAANNTVDFDNGAVGTVASATGTLLTVNLSTLPTKAGPLSVTVTTNGIASDSPVQIAKVIPVITSSVTTLAANAATMNIAGFGFDTTIGNNTVDFDGVAVGSVTAATSNSLTVTFSTTPRVAGALRAIVTTNSASNASAVQVATVRPVVTLASTSIAANASTVTINGFGFDTISSNNTVVFNNGAVGTVSAATATTLNVTFSTKPTTAGNLTAIVTTKSVSSGSAVRVAIVAPVITSRTVGLAANASTVTINGFGFDTTIGNNTVTFNNGAAGTVTSASANSLTVTFSAKPTSAGSLTATVTTNTVASASDIQVANVTPVVTTSSANLNASAATITISGFGFDSTPSNNSVVFNNGAVGTVSTSTPTSMVVTFSTKPATAGSLTAVVTSNSVSSGTAIQVATVKPVVTVRTTNVAANASTITISGFGFSPVLANNQVTFNSGAGTVTAATPTSITVTFSTRPTAGNLTAVVTTNGTNSGTAVQVATIIPFITSSTANFAANATTITINGFGFDSTADNNSVLFDNGATGTIVSSSSTSILLTLTNPPNAAGSLGANVTTNSLANGSYVQVATVIPVVTSTTSNNVSASATTVTINGFGFDATAGNNLVTFNNGAVGTVQSATANSLTVLLSQGPTTAGALRALVTTNSVNNGSPIQVATIIPVVTSSTTSLAANSNTVVIRGFGFDPAASNNTVVFNNSAVGTVSSATPTELTVRFTTLPVLAGSLTAIVTTNSLSSGSAVSVSVVKPVVTSATTNIVAANASSVVIRGFGFDTTGTNNLVTFNNGAAGTVSSATSTSLTVSFTTKPTKAGPLTASVSTNTHNSGSAVTVASIAPVVLANASSIQSANSNTIIVVGVGFDTNPSNNTIIFDSGAVGSVTSATATTLTVSLSTRPTAGNLKATVTSNGINNGANVQVATVRPIVTANATSIAADASTLTINGFGFDSTGSNNTVVFNNGAVGIVSSSTFTSLTVNLTTKPTSAGSLTAVVTSNGISRGTAVQVANVTPVITSSTASLSPNSNTVTIRGFGFDTTASRNIVALNNGAAGTVTSASPTSLTVTFSRKPRTAGPVTATVTTNGFASASGVQIATLTPTVLPNTSYQLGADATTVTINGLGFDVDETRNSVVFNRGAAGTVVAATESTLTVSLSTLPTAAGTLTAVVTTNGLTSGSAVQVAAIAPVVTGSTDAIDAGATQIIIAGIGFDTTIENNSVIFNNGAAGDVIAATSTSLTVSFSTPPTTVGELTAVVTSNSVTSGDPLQVGTVKPVITSSIASLNANATIVVINGVGFSTTLEDNSVTLGNGAVGTITDATATALTVTFTTNPASVGNLTASVTTNAQTSETVQIATVVPVVSSKSYSIAADASTLVIDGFGFDSTAENNVVVFNNGAEGTVTSATYNSLTVSFSTKPVTAGSLTASVTTSTFSSGSPVQVASIIPVVTSSVSNLPANATTLTIQGFGFSSTPSENIVTFNNGAEGIVTASTPTELTVSLSTSPTSAGVLNVVVATDELESGNAVQIATVIPTVTSSINNLAANATTVTINGAGFDAIAANNSVLFNLNAVGIVTSATTTSLTVTFTTKPSVSGQLTAIVTSNGVDSGSAVQIATVTPVVVANSAFLLAADAPTLTINGTGFDTTPENNTVVLNNGAVGTVTAATATSLTVTFSTNPVSAGSLTAIVTTNNAVSGSPIQVATVAPVITSSTTSITASTSTVTINGFGFDPYLSNNSVVLNGVAVGSVTSASATSLTITLTTKPTTAGSLTAVVTSNSVSSGVPVQIAAVTPVVTLATSNLTINSDSVTITGFGFDPTPSQNTVQFNNGTSGSVTSASATSLTVTFAVKPPSVGSLTAIVTTNGLASPSAVQIANVIGVVTPSSDTHSAGDTTLLINGFGFDSTPGNNIVTFTGSTAGTVTAATSNQLTVTLSTLPKAGDLSAFVTTNGVVTGSAVVIANVAPEVTSATTAFSANASTITINGFGFDPIAANNTVEFNKDAVGTVTAATATSLTVELSTKPSTVGSFTAIVTSNSVSSGSAVQIASVTPVVNNSTSNFAINASSIVINGLGFDTTPSNNTVVLSNGASGTVSAATGTSLTVNLTVKPTVIGSLTAVVTTNGLSSGSAVQVGNAIGVITSSTTSRAANNATLTINGFGFDTTATNNTVVLSGGGVGTVTNATANQLTVSMSTLPKAGNLNATVTTNGITTATAQVATVAPVVTSATTSVAAGAATITINGFGFDPVAANNSVTLNKGAAGNVTAATATSLTVTLTANPNASGSLTAVVTTNSVSSGAAVQIASVLPSVSNSTSNVAINAASVVINGFGFSSTPANNTVVFNNGATGTVTSSSATSLTVTFVNKPTAVGSLTAAVTTSGLSSGSPVQIGNVVGVITTSATSRAADNTNLVINGFGFDATPSNNIISFSGGAEGTVTAATATQLTVLITTSPKAGSLTATVTTNGVGTETTQVATVSPVVTSTTTDRPANASTITITGVGFDPVAANNSVVLNLGAAGTVTAATATSLTVTITTAPTAVGNLTAAVTTNSISSGTAVQVARILPAVTSSVANLALTATTVTINGLGFDSTASNNTVVFNNGAVGTVTSASPTSLTVTFSTLPTAGSLTAIVTRNGISSGTAVTVATLRPVVTANTATLSAGAATLTISGAGFSTTAANNTVVFNNGAVGTVTAATATSLTVAMSTKPGVGNLTVIVTTNGVDSGTAVQVGSINPSVTASTASLALNGSTLVINGFGFSTTLASNSVAFSGGVVGTITAATPTALTINLTTKPTALGSLTAVVTTSTRTSGTAVQVAQVVAAGTAPVVRASTNNLAANASTITIGGTGFSATPANNTVVFNNGAVGTVTAATTTSLTVTFSTMPKAGNLTAIVSTSGIPAAATQVASVVPVVTASTDNLSASATTLVINGFGFDTTASNNSVTLTNGAIGTVTAATDTSLTVTFSTRPTSVGSMTAVVTTNTKASVAAVQVARVIPRLNSSTSILGINAASITLTGFAFDTTPSNNVVTFNNGAVGTVTAATATSLTVSLTTKPTSFGSLTAAVSVSSISSGTAVQVADVRPAITASTGNLGANANSITINGDGFSSTPSNNVVTLSNGAVGTITAASTTSLTITFSTKPTAGNLTASVTVSGVANGSNVQVATVIPIVTTSAANLLANASTITINGVGFDTVASRNLVTFNNSAVGTVTAATATSLTVNLTTRPLSAGNLSVSVTTNSANSGTAVQAATVVPVVTSSTTSQSAGATSMTIAGFGFAAVAGSNTVVFSNGAAGTVSQATPTLLTINLTTRPTSLGNMTAVVTSNSVSSGSPVQVSTISPSITVSTASLALTANTVQINGFGFDSTPTNNTVTLNNGAVGTVTSASSTQLTITFSTRPSAGNLTASVSIGGLTSGTAVQIATLIPLVTTSTTSLLANANTVTIAGSGFDSNASRNTVAFNNGAVGTVTAATSTSLTVTFSTKPRNAGSLTAVVTVNGASSGATPIQIANVAPVVTLSTTGLAINAGTVVINGFGFDPTPNKNTVVFNNGATGTVTSASATSLTVTFGTKPTTLGSLTAVVTSNLFSSGTAVQVATAIPVVTEAPTNIITSSSTSVVINGVGFSTTAGNNTVVFNNGAVGTVVSATATALTVNFTTRPTTGNLTAVVTTNGVSSGTPVLVAKLLPTVTTATASLAANSATMTIAGTGFDTTASNNTVVFSNGAVGTVTNATATALTVSFTTRPTVGNLTVTVTTNGASNPTPVQVATVKPVVTANTANQARTLGSILISGFGFSTVASNNTVAFNNGAFGTVASATATTLTVNFTTRPVSAGSLTAIVTTSGQSSGTAVQVATMT